MRSAPYQLSSDPAAKVLPRRAMAVLLALAVHVLLLFMLLRLATSTPSAPEQTPMAATFEMLPPPKAASQARTASKVVRPSGGAAPRNAAQPKDAPVSLPLLPGLEHFNLADVAPSANGSQTASSGSAATGSGSGDSQGAGEGPNGEQLYGVEWQREPTHAELNYYMPANAPAGWGEIICQTIERFHVDNCHELGQTPGSGLAKVVRLAAWQFRVLPPRVGGRPIIGAWVRIRIDFTQTMVK